MYIDPIVAEDVKPLFDLTPIYQKTFRKIPSLNNLYEVNADGTVFRNAITKRPLKVFMDTHHSKSGYMAVFICYQKRVRRIMIHKVVAECWLGTLPANLEIDHIDRDSLNNTYTNLRYVTHSEQMKNRKLSQRIINQAKLNCYTYTMEKVAKSVTLVQDEVRWHFPSMTQCAEFLSNMLGGTSEHYRHYLKKRKTDVCGYTVIYSGG